MADQADRTDQTPPGNTMPSGCELCEAPGGSVLWEDDFCRIVLVEDGGYPGFCRVILQRHCAEMTDLSSADQMRLMSVVLGVEKVLRGLLHPDKINLASLGNVVPHLHWHVVPRWKSDRHYPQPIWGQAQRVNVAVPTISAHRLREELSRRLCADMATSRNFK